MKKLSPSLLLLGTVLLVGCIHVQMASPTLDAAAKNFETEPVKANIYITRTSKWWIANEFAAQILMDGRVAGSLAPNTYAMLSVSPGRHIVALSLEGNVNQKVVEVDPGKNYFFEFKRIAGGYDFSLVPEEQGRKDVLKSKRAQAAMYE